MVFELPSKTRNVLPLSFSATLPSHYTDFLATSYRGKSSEKIVECNISFLALRGIFKALLVVFFLCQFA